MKGKYVYCPVCMEYVSQKELEDCGLCDNLYLEDILEEFEEAEESS